MLIVFLSTLSLRRATFPQFLSMPLISLFLSTLSLRRATSSKIISSSIIAYFYPRSPCGERQSVGYSAVRLFIFLSTLSLRRATAQDILTALNNIFLSTLSLRRATLFRCFSSFCYSISIHALLAESDHFMREDVSYNIHFYPRSPCGERQFRKLLHPGTTRISIHALLAESDSIRTLRTVSVKNFYPRSPCGERRKSQSSRARISEHFYPRSPCGERLNKRCKFSWDNGISIHALLAESDAAWHRFTLRRDFISIHALLAESDSQEIFRA